MPELADMLVAIMVACILLIVLITIVGRIVMKEWLPLASFLFVLAAVFGLGFMAGQMMVIRK
jgi:hypothetical protein